MSIRPEHFADRYDIKNAEIHVDENGSFHRVDGPAFKTNTEEFWLRHGYFHAAKVPAIQKIEHGKKVEIWCWQGEIVESGYPSKGC